MFAIVNCASHVYGAVINMVPVCIQPPPEVQFIDFLPIFRSFVPFSFIQYVSTSTYNATPLAKFVCSLITARIDLRWFRARKLKHFHNLICVHCDGFRFNELSRKPSRLRGGFVFAFTIFFFDERRRRRSSPRWIIFRIVWLVQRDRGSPSSEMW